MRKGVIRVGIRPSPLALKQAEEIKPLLKKRFPEARVVIKKILTRGDKDKATPISDVEGSDFFTREIDEALIKGEIDIGVHSSKDLPDRLRKGLRVLFETDSISPFDALVTRSHVKLRELPAKSRIGTSSMRRKERIKGLRPDLRVTNVRGNIQERLRLIDNGKIDGLIVAHAALIRLGLEERISEILPLELFPAHPGQGKLSAVARR